MVAPIMDQLAGKYDGKVKNREGGRGRQSGDRAALQCPVDSEYLFFKDGRHVDTLVGAYPSQAFEQKIEQHLS